MKSKALRMMIALLLFWTMIPVLMGGCPCAHAGEKPIQGLLLQKVPCHGCCPEIQTGRDPQTFEPVEPMGFQCSRQQARLYFLSSSVSSLEISPFLDGPEAKAPPGVVAAGSTFASTPIYLALQVLRV